MLCLTSALASVKCRSFGLGMSCREDEAIGDGGLWETAALPTTPRMPPDEDDDNEDDEFDLVSNLWGELFACDGLDILGDLWRGLFVCDDFDVLGGLLMELLACDSRPEPVTPPSDVELVLCCEYRFTVDCQYEYLSIFGLTRCQHLPTFDIRFRLE